MRGDPENLCWIDMEMSGLDPTSCVIIEIASLVTDRDLNVLAQGPEIVIHQSQAILEAMDDWNKAHHGQSGLTALVQQSHIAVEQAEIATLDFFRIWCPPKSSPLCGNTIYQDRRFLIEYMPRLEDFFHYRIVDVSSIKELVRRWYPDRQAPKPEKAHRALDDIMASVEELQYYREHVFR